ncbi:MAG: 4-hydroxy-3-methylbut-2-enyl diphosphate reductase [Candidatus Neomarinimicrobiota bacterium]|nr:4-hydroxy-3-methylbut-2-enyl diphosphate reductase [Candidatus Neomarinimicrobiota bacterium]MEC9007351.1 4-hydroxy-3-methylbut-2-enyl diphosphate reductase [Candidatus Neomarinimicrobiota bacterium]MEC9437146.1 4-hydroxy-3-methylbut-2-enyl diphosphate reductase [Candidatus Neomarinimicrobiota bacterium]MEC9474782.1 4-hydroxy-3-methylbut-2-enyl diphosphate reductase [Candidatus Neomarinimicrobiota bacterium]MEE3302541.1 4-hydroxy-3-methylbut-2-enyl diphosphate reductase [Candidatus Neomarini|tara:strand:+ start:554 stop:1414 length:861 start_codon:yes stop_codon:yes gene_type:complete
MKILLAKNAGYCFGVRDAVNMAYDTAEEYGDVYMLGHIVHNENVVDDLDKAGAKVVDSLDEVPDGRPVLLRAHGTHVDTWEEAKKKNMNIVDATCPLVRDIHDEIKELESDGRKIIIIGDHGHDEVVGIASQVKDPVVVATTEEARHLRKTKRAGIVSQSTQTIENVQEIVNILMSKVVDLRFINTICFPTKRNQEQIKELSEKCDVMIVIGSFTSANSKRLTDLSNQRNKRSYQVTCALEIDEKWLKDCDTVGISAGASTPDNIIKEVIDRVKEIGNVQEEEIYA